MEVSNQGSMPSGSWPNLISSVKSAATTQRSEVGGSRLL